VQLGVYEALLELSQIDRTEKSFAVCEMLTGLSVNQVKSPQDDHFYDEINLKAAKSLLGTLTASTIELKERKLEFLKKLKSAFRYIEAKKEASLIDSTISAIKQKLRK
jgi:hypothetical protein